MSIEKMKKIRKYKISRMGNSAVFAFREFG